MNRKSKNSPLLPIAAVFMLLALMSCGSSSGGPATANQDSESFGSIGILLKDAPADEFQNIYITINEISLLPAPGEENPLVIFTSEEGYTIDLLDLRDQDFLLTLNEKVPVGTYSKVRMKISGINAVGGPCEDMEIDLPSGKIDINPQGSFTVEEGDVLYLRLDIDANKSINLHPAGKSGKCIFRPVVFAEVIPEENPATPCSMLFKGAISSLIYLTPDLIPEGFVLQRECPCQGALTVKLDESTLILSEDNVFSDPEVLQVDQALTVYGYLDELGALNAAFMVLGDALAVEGVVSGITDADTIIVAPDLGEEITGSTVVNLSPESLILTLCGQEMTFADITAGAGVVLVGRYDATSYSFHAISVMIKP